MNETFQLETIVALDGRRKNPIHWNPFVVVSHLVCCIIGIPINLFLAVVIIYMRRLRSKPRNIFLLGLVLSNLSAFFPLLIEFAYFFFPKNEELCQIYVSIVGLPYVLFLNHMLLALADRHTAIAHPFWHYKRVTVRRALCWQLLTSLLVSTVYKFAYIAQLIPLRCEVQLLQVRIISVTMIIMFSTCILAQVIVYRETKKMLASYAAKGVTQLIPLSLISNRANVNTDHPQSSDQQSNLSALPVTSEELETTATKVELKVHMSSRTITRMEIEATRTLITSVTSLFIMTGPFILYTLIVFSCRIFYEQHYCSSITWLSPYFKELIVFYAVYHPIVYLFRSSEISSALRDHWLKT